MTDSDLFSTWIQIIVVTALNEVIHRLGLVIHKIFHLKERSKFTVKLAIRSEFNIDSLPRATAAAFAVSHLIFLICFVTGFREQRILITCFILSPLLWLSKKKEQNVAVGLAWSFYFGYLKIVLPELLANINYSKYRDELAEKAKVFILIPTDCQVFDELRDKDDRLEFVENLEPVKKNIAGIKVRKYVHSVYRICPDGEQPFLAILEYATPLRTLHQMSIHREAGLSDFERDRQVTLFYDELKDIINNYAHPPEIKERVELVLLTGKGREIADEIMRRVNPVQVEMSKQD